MGEEKLIEVLSKFVYMPNNQNTQSAITRTISEYFGITYKEAAGYVYFDNNRALISEDIWTTKGETECLNVTEKLGN